MRKITRAFRENSRVLLLLFMSLLLVIFLLGNVVGRGNRGDQFRDAEIGTAFGGEKVMLSQVNRTGEDWQMAETLLPEMRGVRSQIPSDNLLYLLTREAELAGVRVGPEEVRTHLVQLGDAQNFALERFRRQGRSLESIYEGIGRALSVMEYLTLQIDSVSGDSIPQLKHAYQQQLQSAVVNYAVLDDKAWLSQAPEPTPQEIEEHFAEAKDRTTQHSTDAISFGYRVPEKVEIEYLTVDPRDLVNKMIVRDREVERFYEENKARYTKRVVQSQPASAPAGTPPPQAQVVQLTLDECREAVKNDLRQQRASEEAGALVNRIQEELRRPWTAPPSADGTRPVPTAPAPSFEELRAKYSTQYPVMYRKTNLVERPELMRDPDLASYRATFDQRQFALAQQAFNVEGLTDGKAAPSLPLLKPMEPSNVFVVLHGKQPYQSMVFRVVRAVPAGPPASLDDVKSQVIDNLKLIKAHALAGEWARKLADAAREKGLDAAVSDAAELKAILTAADGPPVGTQPTTAPAKEFTKELGPHTEEKFTRRSANLAFGVQNSKLPTEIFDLTQTTATTAAHTVVMLPVAGNFRWVIAELIKVNPIYEGEFDTLRPMVAASRSRQLTQMFLQTWLDPAHIELRTGFTAAAGAPSSSGS